MLVKLKSSRNSVVKAETGESAKVKFLIENLNITETHYSFNGHYFREITETVGEEQVITKEILSQVDESYPIESVTALCAANGLPDIVSAVLNAIKPVALTVVKTKRKYQTIPSDWSINND